MRDALGGRGLAGEVHTWIRAHAARLGLRTTRAIEQLHVRPWPTVLRVPTKDGDVWFKTRLRKQGEAWYGRAMPIGSNTTN